MSFDPGSPVGLYNPRGLQRAVKALANADSAPCTIMTIGDSVTEGTGIGTGNDKSGLNFQDKRWANLLLKWLQAEFTTAGYGGVGYVNEFSNVVNGSTAGSAYWTHSGGAATNSGGWFGGRGWNGTTNTTATFTFYGTGFTFITGNNAAAYVANGQSFTYAVDGGAGTTFTYVSSGGPNTVAVTGLTRGVHTVVFTPASGKQLYLGGAMAFDGDETTGVHLIESARFGITSTAAASALVGGNTLGTAQLVTVFLGLNGATGTQYATDIASIVKQARNNHSGTTAASSPSILLIAPYEQSAVPSTVSHVQAAQLRAIADKDPLNISVLSLADAFSGTAAENATAGLMVTDNLHPTNRGHSRIAKAVYRAIQAAS